MLQLNLIWKPFTRIKVEDRYAIYIFIENQEIDIKYITKRLT